MIEKHKWDYLADIRARTASRTLYINATPKGIYEFDLGALNEPEWVLKVLPTKTDFAGSSKVEKAVGFIDIKESRLLLICYTRSRIYTGPSTTISIYLTTHPASN